MYNVSVREAIKHNRECRNTPSAVRWDRNNNVGRYFSLRGSGLGRVFKIIGATANGNYHAINTKNGAQHNNITTADMGNLY